MLISSLAFGFAHVLHGGDRNHIWVYALNGVTFSLLLIFSKDIKTCMIYHALTNAFPIFNHNHLSLTDDLYSFAHYICSLFSKKLPKMALVYLVHKVTTLKVTLSLQKAANSIY